MEVFYWYYLRASLMLIESRRIGRVNEELILLKIIGWRNVYLGYIKFSKYLVAWNNSDN